MYNMRFNAILNGLIIGLASIFILSCERVDNTPSTPVDNISIMLDVDELSLESASIRVRHDGDPNALWVYMNTLDMESDAAKLLTEKLLEREVSTDDHKKLIDSFIESIGDEDDAN